MVGRAGEGEEEQAVVRVPRLVKDCVSRHARLLRFSSRSPGRSVSTSTSLSGSSACFLSPLALSASQYRNLRMLD